MSLDFTPDEIQRYARHILLPEIGGTGQARLREARVLIIGAGGLGAPISLYLAAAGIGHIGIVDHDTLELSNLQRQVLFDTADLGQPKADLAAKRLRALNPDITIEAHTLRADAQVLGALVPQYDLVCDGCDNFETRYAVSDACTKAGRTLVSAAVLRYAGQLSTFSPHKGGPCYRCLFPDAEASDSLSCAEAGVFGAVTGVLGTLAATEILKEILGLGQGLSGRVLTWDALSARFQEFALHPNPECPGCGKPA